MPWQTRISCPFRARRDKAWSTAALLPRCNRAFGCTGAPSGNAAAYSLIWLAKPDTVDSLPGQKYIIYSDALPIDPTLKNVQTWRSTGRTDEWRSCSDNNILA